MNFDLCIVDMYQQQQTTVKIFRVQGLTYYTRDYNVVQQLPLCRNRVQKRTCCGKMLKNQLQDVLGPHQSTQILIWRPMFYLSVCSQHLIYSIQEMTGIYNALAMTVIDVFELGVEQENIASTTHKKLTSKTH